MSEKPYHHGDLEAALTNAALDFVQTSGIGALTLRDLARTLGVSPSAAYRHFPSRDHLVSRISQAARESLAQALLEARDAVISNGRAKRRSIERFEAIGRAYVLFATQNPSLFAAAFVLCDVSPSTEDNPSAWSVLVDSVEEMVESGAIPASRRADAPIIAWGVLIGVRTCQSQSNMFTLKYVSPSTRARELAVCGSHLVEHA